MEFEEGQYEGDFVNGKKHGEGTVWFKSSDHYVGHFESGQYHGHGEFTFASGEKFVGEFQTGKSVNGTYYYNDGNIYTGSFCTSFRRFFD
jgi:hypothetical protein